MVLDTSQDSAMPDNSAVSVEAKQTLSRGDVKSKHFCSHQAKLNGLTSLVPSVLCLEQISQQLHACTGFAIRRSSTAVYDNQQNAVEHNCSTAVWMWHHTYYTNGLKQAKSVKYHQWIGHPVLSHR